MRRTFASVPVRAGATLLRPVAATIPPGGMFLDRLTGLPQWSDGAAWRDATGIEVPDLVAPTAAFTVGTQVGVPTGLSLTDTTGLPAADGQVTLLLVHPVTGQVAARTCSVWRRRRWTTLLQPNPPAGATWLFENCRFENTLDNYCVDVIEDHGVADIMAPLAVFRHCEFDGGSTTGRGLNAPYSWVISSDVRHAEDAWGGGVYSVGIGNNLIADTDGQGDPHPDGFQISGAGRTVLYRNWISGGGPDGNSAVHIATDFSHVQDVDLYFNGLDAGGWCLQVRGDPGDRGVDRVTVRGNRWTGTSGFGPVDFEQVTNLTWVDNALMDGTPIGSPV